MDMSIGITETSHNWGSYSVVVVDVYTCDIADVIIGRGPYSSAVVLGAWSAYGIRPSDD